MSWLLGVVNANGNNTGRNAILSEAGKSEYFRKSLRRFLKDSSGPIGSVCVQGAIPKGMPFPSIQIRSTKELIGLPVATAEAAHRIIQHSQQAPFGKGTKTITDKKVRDCWQLDSSQIHITNPLWDDAVQALVHESVAPDLGIQNSETCVKAELYKLLLYEKGGHFKPHRDSEKADGMFGTLIVQLPSLYSGGSILVKHNQKTHVIDFASRSGAEYLFQFAAFYADCEHEVKPLESGYRVALIYNLLFTGKGNIPLAPTDNQEASVLSKLLQKFNSPKSSIAKPERIVIPLNHMYSETSLRAKNLKGKDAQLFSSLRRFNSQGVIQLQLGVLGITEYGNEEYEDDSDMNQHYDIKVLRVFEPGASDDGTALEQPIKSSVPDEQILQVHLKLSSLDPYRHESHPTGNEGTEVTRFYRTSALVICPAYLKHMIHFSRDNVDSYLKYVNRVISDGKPQDLDNADALVMPLLRSDSFLSNTTAMRNMLKLLLPVKCAPNASIKIISSICATNLDAKEFYGNTTKFVSSFGDQKLVDLLTSVQENLQSSKLPFVQLTQFGENISKSVDRRTDNYTSITESISRGIINHFVRKISQKPQYYSIDFPSEYQMLLKYLSSMPDELSRDLKMEVANLMLQSSNDTIISRLFEGKSNSVSNFISEIMQLSGCSDGLWKKMRSGLLSWAAAFLNSQTMESYLLELSKIESFEPKTNAPEKEQTLKELFRLPIRSFAGNLQKSAEVIKYVASISDVSLQREIADEYVDSLVGTNNAAHVIRKITQTNALLLRDTLVQVNTLRSTFVAEICADMRRLCDQSEFRSCLSQAAVMMTALCLIGKQREIELFVPALLLMGNNDLTQLCKVLQSTLRLAQVDPSTHPLYIPIAMEAYKRQRAVVDAEIEKVNSGAVSLSISTWPCGRYCRTCGNSVTSFLSDKSESMIWTSNLATKSLQIRDATHVYDSGVRAGLICEKLPPKSVKLTKNVHLIRKKLRAAKEALMGPYNELISGIRVNYTATPRPVAAPLTTPVVPPAPVAPPARGRVAVVAATSVPFLPNATPSSLQTIHTTGPSSAIQIDLTAEDEDEIEPSPKRRKV